MTNDDLPDLDILIRIEKLLAKSEDQGCTQPERDSFQAKAFELIERHRIDRALIGGHLVADDILETRRLGDFNGLYGRVRINVVAAVARAFDVNIFWSGFKNTRHLQAYGFKSDIDRVQGLANRLLADCDLRVKFLDGYDMKDTIRQRRGFYLGYSDEIAYRLLSARKAAEVAAKQEGVDMAGAALVLVDRKRQVNDAFREAHKTRAAGDIGQGGWDGHSQGAAGRSADLSHRNAVGNQKTLGR